MGIIKRFIQGGKIKNYEQKKKLKDIKFCVAQDRARKKDIEFKHRKGK